MAKSTRSKTKRAFRRIKRETGVFAANDAARLQRLSAKLKNVADRDQDGDVAIENGEEDDADTQTPLVMDGGDVEQQKASMDVEASQSQSKKISTHGPRDSRRNSWRKSKGMPVKRKGRPHGRK